MNSPSKATIGQAIDQTMTALSSLEKREQQIVISTICSLLDITLPGPSAVDSGQPPAGSHKNVSQKPSTPSDEAKRAEQQSFPETHKKHGVDIRSLKNEKQPVGAIQMACVAAYYLQEHAPEEERVKEVSTADLERLFKQAGFKLPSRMQQVLPDAKTAGYFESVDRGKYKLTRVGYNLVTHSLPKATRA